MHINQLRLYRTTSSSRVYNHIENKSFSLPWNIRGKRAFYRGYFQPSELQLRLLADNLRLIRPTFCLDLSYKHFEGAFLLDVLDKAGVRGEKREVSILLVTQPKTWSPARNIYAVCSALVWNAELWIGISAALLIIMNTTVSGLDYMYLSAYAEDINDRARINVQNTGNLLADSLLKSRLCDRFTEPNHWERSFPYSAPSARLSGILMVFPPGMKASTFRNAAMKTVHTLSRFLIMRAWLNAAAIWRLSQGIHSKYLTALLSASLLPRTDYLHISRQRKLRTKWEWKDDVIGK